jgi:hypothetical protein
MRAVFAQDGLLRRGRSQAVLRHTKTLTSTTDIPEEVKRCAALARKPGSLRRDSDDRSS